MRKWIVVCCLTLLCTVAFSKNLGTEGQVFGIAEQDFRTFVHEHLLELQQTGALKRYEQQTKARVKRDITHPRALPLSTQSETQTYTVDPSVRLDRPITDNLGRILVPAGTVINPFKTVHLQSVLFFFNGDDPQQVRWVKTHYTHYHWVKLILTGGNIPQLAKTFGRLYFDQHGAITAKLHIHHVPAIAQQKKLMWQITVIGNKQF